MRKNSSLKEGVSEGQFLRGGSKAGFWVSSLSNRCSSEQGVYKAIENRERNWHVSNRQ